MFSNLFISVFLKQIMQGLLKKLEDNLKLKNYSKETIKGYLFYVKKFLEFAQDKGINEKSAKDFLLNKLDKNNPSSIGHNVFAIKYFFKEILNENLNIPNPKRNKTIPDLSNLYELPQDCLERAGVIVNDRIIESHDLSRRLPSKQNEIEIFILRHRNDVDLWK